MNIGWQIILNFANLRICQLAAIIRKCVTLEITHVTPETDRALGSSWFDREYRDINLFKLFQITANSYFIRRDVVNPDGKIVVKKLNSIHCIVG